MSAKRKSQTDSIFRVAPEILCRYRHVLHTCSLPEHPAQAPSSEVLEMKRGLILFALVAPWQEHRYHSFWHLCVHFRAHQPQSIGQTPSQAFTCRKTPC